jgi:hypothetical protein
LTTEKKSGHGGKREGAGRKPKEKLIRRAVTLPKKHIEYLTALGDGDLSAGLRKLLDEKIGPEEGEGQTRRVDRLEL